MRLKTFSVILGGTVCNCGN